jgi:hypothetical protein
MKAGQSGWTVARVRKRSSGAGADGRLKGPRGVVSSPCRLATKALVSV